MQQLQNYDIMRYPLLKVLLWLLLFYVLTALKPKRIIKMLSGEYLLF